MSHYDYEVSKHIAGHDYPFYALLMALMRQADTDNLNKLKAIWPEVYAELEQRYNAPGGILANERMDRTGRGAA